MSVEELVMGIVGTWLVGVPYFDVSVSYTLPLRGYIPVDVSALPTPLTSWENGITSTQGRCVRPGLSHSWIATVGVFYQHLVGSLYLMKVGREENPSALVGIVHPTWDPSGSSGHDDGEGRS